MLYATLDRYIKGFFVLWIKCMCSPTRILHECVELMSHTHRPRLLIIFISFRPKTVIPPKFLFFRSIITLFLYGVAVLDESPPSNPVLRHFKAQVFLPAVRHNTGLPSRPGSSSLPSATIPPTNDDVQFKLLLKPLVTDVFGNS